MSRDMNKAVRKDLEMIKDSSSRKAQAHILMRNQGPSTIFQTMSNKREQRQREPPSIEKVPSCLELKPCMGNNKDLTNINVVINSEVAKDIIENNQKGNDNKDLTNINMVINLR